DGSLSIVDYKTELRSARSQPNPRHAFQMQTYEETIDLHLKCMTRVRSARSQPNPRHAFQMQVYSFLVSLLHPGKIVRAHLLFTQTGEIETHVFSEASHEELKQEIRERITAIRHDE